MSTGKFALWHAGTMVFACLLTCPVACGAEELKVSTWNLNWLTSRTRAEANLPADVHTRSAADFLRLAGYAKKLAADIVAFQEVDGPDAAALVFDRSRYTIVTIDEKVVQRVGLAVRHDIAVTRHADYAALDVEAGAPFPLRDGLDVTLSLPGGKALRVLVVHLKTGCHTDDLARSRRPQCGLLAQQGGPLAAWVAARHTENVPFLLMGDFNRIFDVPEALGAALARAAPLTRVTEGHENPCWDGAPFIDHIFAGGAAIDWIEPGTLRVQVFRETEKSEKENLSDHCPVSVKLDTNR